MKEINQHLNQLENRLQMLEQRIQSVADSHGAVLLVLAYLLDQMPDHAGVHFLYNQIRELDGQHESHLLHEIYDLLVRGWDRHGNKTFR